MEKYSATRGQAKVYRIVLEERSGWADITIESYFNGGSLKIISDFGDYACIWNNTGPAKPFEEFLCDLSFDYFMEKASVEPYLLFDMNETINNIKKDILKFRKEKIFDPYQARLLYDNIDYCFDRYFIDSEDFLDYLEDIGFSEKFCANSLNDYQFPISQKYDEQCLAFWETIWPCFCDALQREIACDRLEFY